MKGVALAASTAFRGVCDQRSGALDLEVVEDNGDNGGSKTSRVKVFAKVSTQF